LRTVAHELVHYSQHQHGIRGSGKSGSATEDKANLKAGEILRDFGASHSYLFGLKSIK